MAFTYAPGRSGKYAVDILQDFEGILQVPSHGLPANHCRAMDGYVGYNRVLDPRNNDPIQLACCWAHAPSRDFAKQNPAGQWSQATSEVDLLRNVWQRNSKSQCQRSRPSKSGWITQEHRSPPNPQQVQPSNTSPNIGTASLI
ncbi:MAG: hypothetical protein ACI8Z0_002478 [Lentimonas sp.]